MNPRAVTPLLVAFVLLNNAESSRAANPAEDARRVTLAEVARLLRMEYVRDSAGSACAGALDEAATAGRFPAALRDREFAEAVTEWLRKCARDEHLELVTSAPARPESAGATTSAEDWVTALRRRNFDVPQVRRLSGNVGYMELASFPPPDVAGEAVAHAMGLLEHTDALVIDLRRNSGGAGDMVRFLGTWLFDRSVAITSTWRRADGRLTEDRTLPWIPGKRRPTTPVFLLTSRGTFSAAEAFAFGLQQLGRAKVVGERTRGGANAGRYRDAGQGFRMFVPMANARSPVNGSTWDRIGVTPDVPVAADSALEVAHEAALDTLIASSGGDSTLSRQWQWARDGVRAGRLGISTSVAACDRFVGMYEGGCRVDCRGGRLRYSRDGGPDRPLQPVGGDRFLIEDVDGRMLRFEGRGNARTLVIVSARGNEERLQLTSRSPAPR